MPTLFANWIIIIAAFRSILHTRHREPKLLVFVNTVTCMHTHTHSTDIHYFIAFGIHNACIWIWIHVILSNVHGARAFILQSAHQHPTVFNNTNIRTFTWQHNFRYHTVFVVFFPSSSCSHAASVYVYDKYVSRRQHNENG